MPAVLPTLRSEHGSGGRCAAAASVCQYTSLRNAQQLQLAWPAVSAVKWPLFDSGCMSCGVAANAHKSACLGRRFLTAAMVSILHGENTLCRQLALVHASYGANQACEEDAALPTLLLH